MSLTRLIEVTIDKNKINSKQDGLSAIKNRPDPLSFVKRGRADRMRNLKNRDKSTDFGISLLLLEADDAFLSPLRIADVVLAATVAEPVVGVVAALAETWEPLA